MYFYNLQAHNEMNKTARKQIEKTQQSESKHGVSLYPVVCLPFFYA